MTSVSSRAGRTIFSFRNMISRERYTEILRATVFLAVLLLCFLPSLEEIVFCQDLSPVALPSDRFADGEERNFSEPLNDSDSFQNSALFQQLVSSHETFAPSRRSSEDAATQGHSRVTPYRLTPRPPPSLR